MPVADEVGGDNSRHVSHPAFAEPATGGQSRK